MINPSSFDIRVKDSVINPNQLQRKAAPNAHFKKSRTGKANNMYKVHIYLEGNDLAFVKQATYKLHETFPNPIQTVERSVNNTNCMLTIWTWGIFTIKVAVENIKGDIIKLEHRLEYSREIQQSKDDLNWIKE